MRELRYLAIALIAITAVACFKEEKQGTLMRIAVYSQEREDSDIVPATDLESYAFWVKKGSKWKVSSWEDALAKRVTNTDRPAEQLTEPDEIGDFDPEAEYQVTLELWAESTFIVVVDKANRLYAYRQYDTPINLPELPIQLHMYAWRKSGTANGWDMINPFYEEKSESATSGATTENEIVE
ncbi:MAG: hypothetical protein IIW45_06355 [Alistipes sp.]|nr:hypothetical protein [Alistipes sp.]